MNMGKKNGIPDRWESYSNMGRHIPGTRFISFKVPLDKKYESKGGNFSLRDLTDHCPRLGIVIDLTNTNRYYNPEELTDLNIGYRKIYTEGHVLPSKGVVWEFMDAVTTFLEANEHNDKLVGVHCTHGVNRTGYLVCRYMIQLLDFAPDQAIADFDSARGHAQERRLYTDDLRLASWINEDPFDYKKTSVGGRHNNSGGWENRQGRAPHPAYHNTNNSYGDGSRRGGGRGGGGDTSSAAFESPVSNGDASVGGCRRRGDREYLKARRSQDSSSSWRVTPIAAATGTLDDAVKENVKDTPRGTKRRMDRSESSSSARAPWLPPCGDDAEPSPEPPRRRFKRESQYGAASHQRYDPYYYQQRQGGGPTRTEGHWREAVAVGPAVVPAAAGGELKQYRGPRRGYRSPQRTAPRPGGVDLDDREEGRRLGLEDHEPLTFDRVPATGFLGGAAAPTGPVRDPRSPCTQPDVFSPEPPSPPGLGRRRRSKRFEPY